MPEHPCRPRGVGAGDHDGRRGRRGSADDTGAGGDARAAEATRAVARPGLHNRRADAGQYVQGRFRGERLAYGELEYRWTVKRNGLLGIVAFLNTETLSNEDTGEHLFDSFANGFGVGLRLMMNKRSKTNLAFDVGRGNEGEIRIYFAVQEAF